MKFVKKPIPVDAVKCIKENEDEIIKLLNNGTTDYEPITQGDEIIGFDIHSWEGVDPVYYDYSKNKNGGGKPYWIIKGLKGEVYPCVADDEEDAPLGYQEYKEEVVTE